MTKLDWIALAFIGINALAGLRRGLIGTVLSLAGLVGGAALGDHYAPQLLSAGSRSPYTPLVTLGGALVGALLLRAAAAVIASFARSGLRLIPPLHALDSIGGLIAGAASGIVIVWVLGAVALQFPGQTTLRRDVQRSEVLRRLNALAPPNELLHALDRIDELPLVSGPAPASAALPPDPAVLDEPAVRAAEPSVVRVIADACGLGVEGSGWVAESQLVVTAAHVVAGTTGIRVDGRPARLFAISRRNDVAVLDVPGLDARPLPFGTAHAGMPVAVLGYPGGGSFAAAPGRIGATLSVRVSGVARPVTELSARVEHGTSGGPALDANGVVETTIFAARAGSNAGYGVTTGAVQAALEQAHRPVPSGSC